jgi:membrane protease subunit (stomatin/prohibitin family)
MARIIDVIDHTFASPDELVWKEPQRGQGDFRMGSQVIVSESQAAVFFRGGQALDVLGPGRHTLSTANLPILSGLIGLATSGRTPFTAELYFVNMRDMPQVGWGTNPPIVLETPGRGLGVVLLIGHGVIDIGVDDPARFVKQYAVNLPVVRLSDIKDRIQAMLLGEIAELLMKSGAQSVADVNRILSDLKGAMLVKLNEKFQALGMRIKAFEAVPFRAKENVTIDELRDYITDFDTFERLRRLEIAEKAASNEGAGGALAGAGVGLGVGQTLGAAMNPDVSALQQQLAQQQMLMQQLMMTMMQNRGRGAEAPAEQAAPSTQSAANPPAPQTKAEIEALIDALDVRFAKGEISESAYNRLIEKWQQRLRELS